MKHFIAIDWGTTNRRVYAIDSDGRVEATERDDCGVLAMTGRDYATEVDAIRARHGGRPVLCAGMVGSAIGWQLVPYVGLPVRIADLARATVPVADGVMILPGARMVDERADVMRGEEVQLLGAANTSLTPSTAWLCQPGTHCKWARLVDGRLVGFTTAMTGEMYALLKSHSLLAAQLSGEARPGAAFDQGVTEGARGDLLASLFGVRARGLTAEVPANDAASLVSGMLIGSEVSMRLKEVGGESVHVLASGTLATLYASAVTTLGGVSHAVDSNAAFVAGITAVCRELQ